MKNKINYFFMNNKEGHNRNIYFLVPGFLGNFSEGLFKKISDFLISKGELIEECLFKGHEKGGIELDPIDKMTDRTFSRILKIRESNPNKHVIIITHSQGCAIISKMISFFDANTSIIFLSPAIYVSEMLQYRISEDDLKKIDAGKSIKCELAQNKYRIINKEWIDSYRNFCINEKDLRSSRQSCLAIRPINDYIPKKNFDVLKNNIPKIDYFEIEGDHIFKNPRNSMKELIEKITMWINKK